MGPHLSTNSPRCRPSGTDAFGRLARRFPAVAAALLLALSACTPPGSALSRFTEGGRLLSEGPAAGMTGGQIEQLRAGEVPLLYYFAVESGQRITYPASTLEQQQRALGDVQDWAAVTLVGQGYIDTQCQRFLSALHTLDRSRRTTLTNLNTLQSATVGILGLARAAQQAIGIVGISFGLTTSLFDTTVSTFLYELPPSSIVSIVEAQRQLLRVNEAEVLATIKNQGDARARLGQYLLYCVPVTIEANVSKVLNNSRAGRDGLIVTADTPAAVSSPPLRGTGIAQNRAAVVLRRYLEAEDLTAAERSARNELVRTAMRAERVANATVASFLFDASPGAEEAQARVARRLGLQSF
jgi:hypothetical protein